MEGMAHPLSTLFLLVGLLVPVATLASGGGEKAPAEEVVSLSLIVLSASPDHASTGFPMEVPPYLWNDFRLSGGKVETTADTRYRQVGGMGIKRQRFGELELSRIDLRVAWSRASRATPATVRVSFELGALLGADGSVAMQPGQYALAEAIRQSGKTSGKARVSSIETSGERGFVAEVLVL